MKGRASDTDLAALAERFSCHCYQGYQGADCREMQTADGCSGPSSLPGSLLTLCLLVSMSIAEADFKKTSYLAIPWCVAQFIVIVMYLLEWLPMFGMAV